MPKTKAKGTYPILNKSIRRTYPHYEVLPDGFKLLHAGESQAEAIKALGLKMDASTLSAYENGRADCPASLLVKMADRYGCSVDGLLSRDMTGFRYGSYNPRLELLKIAVAENNLQFTLTKDEKKVYLLDEKFSKDLKVKALRVSEDLPTLNAKKGDVILIDTNLKKYIKPDMSTKLMCMFTNNARDALDTRYWFGYINQVYDGTGITRGKCFYYNLPNGEMQLCRYDLLDSRIYAVVIQVINYYI